MALLERAGSGSSDSSPDSPHFAVVTGVGSLRKYLRAQASAKVDFEDEFDLWTEYVPSKTRQKSSAPRLRNGYGGGTEAMSMSSSDSVSFPNTSQDNSSVQLLSEKVLEPLEFSIPVPPKSPKTNRPSKFKGSRFDTA